MQKRDFCVKHQYNLVAPELYVFDWHNVWVSMRLGIANQLFVQFKAAWWVKAN